jgi:HEAT repeat protein
MLVKDEVANVRGFAAHVLIFHPSTEAIPELTIALKDNTAGVRGLAANALLELGPEARNVLPTLQELMKDSDPWVRANAAGAYIVVGGDVDVGLPVLEASATEKAPHPRWAAGNALARVGQRYPQRVTPALSKLLNDPDPEVRHQTTVAVDLAELKTEGLVPALVVNLKDENFAVRKSAVRTLRRIGLGDDAALAILGTMSRNDPDGGVQDEAKHALETLLTARRTKAKAAP